MFRFLIPMLLAAAPSFSHDWYGYECCSGKDCAPISDSAVKPTPLGYHITTNGRTVEYKSYKIKESKDDKFHLCTIGGDPKGQILCLYVPPQLF